MNDLIGNFRASVAALLSLLAGCLLMAGCEPQAAAPAPLQIQQILGEQASDGFTQALDVRPFQFPDDHGPHFGFRDEWWYVTGNLRSQDGRRFGFQLTFFRHQLRPETTEAKGWAEPQIYMAHFALSDIDGRRYQFFERFGRPGAGVAGARAHPFAVWLDDWRLENAGDASGDWQLRAQAGALQLQLRLTPSYAPVPQGDRGLSRKSAQPGNASYYYSQPQMRATGKLRDSEGHAHAVAGKAWLDREWSTSALSKNQSGWDWFALQLEDGRALMLYQLRRRDGGADPFSDAALIARDGSRQNLTGEQWRLSPQAYWTSPDGARYPIRWRLRIPDQDIDWVISAALPGQWFNGSFRYWEGAVDILPAQGGPALGSGYLEMTGYRPKTSLHNQDQTIQ